MLLLNKPLTGTFEKLEDPLTVGIKFEIGNIAILGRIRAF
jgi:hypothetical protein